MSTKNNPKIEMKSSKRNRNNGYPCLIPGVENNSSFIFHTMCWIPPIMYCLLSTIFEIITFCNENVLQANVYWQKVTNDCHRSVNVNLRMISTVWHKAISARRLTKVVNNRSLNKKIGRVIDLLVQYSLLRKRRNTIENIMLQGLFSIRRIDGKKEKRL